MQRKEILSIVSCIKSACISVYKSLLESNTTNQTENFKINNSGDIQNSLDILANNIIIRYLKTNPHIKYLASEEENNIIPVNENGKYFVAFDPLDGSGNISVELSLGSIFVIFNEKPKNGRDILFAGYCLYTYQCFMIYSFGNNKVYKDYIFDIPFKVPVSCKNIIESISKDNSYCCINNKFKNFNKEIEDKFKSTKNYRWTGCMVSDIHRIIVNTGYFCYPDNKLRLLYECYPMSFLINNLGGLSYSIDNSDGYKIKGNILDIPFPVENIHQKVGILIHNPGKIVSKI